MRHPFAVLWLLIAASGGVAQPVPEPPPAQPFDPDVEPVQYVEPPPMGNGLMLAPAGGDSGVPLVRVHVRAPSAIAPGVPIKYTLTVQNVSAATAYRVQVRHPHPAEADGVPKCDPVPERFNPQAAAAVYRWEFAELGPGKSRVMTVEHTLKPGSKTIRASAFVSFEHGLVVTTEVRQPRLEVRKSAPPTAVAGEPIPVRIEISNPTPVSIENVVIHETFPQDGVEFRGDADTTKTPNQRAFMVGTLRPGERKVIGYQLLARNSAEVLATTAVTGRGVAEAQMKESTTRVLAAALKVDLTGPARTDTGAAAEYVATVTNTGTLPLSAVRVTAQIPEGCTAAAMSAGGRAGRNELVWVGPPQSEKGPLRAGEKFEVRFKLKSTRAGERVVRVNAETNRVEDQAEAKTAFDGGPILRGRSELDQGRTTVGAQGLLTYTAKNLGDGVAKGVRLTVIVPPEVRVIQKTGQARQEGNEVVFDPTDLAAGDEITYTLTYEGVTEGRAAFTLRLADATSRPTESVKEVVISPRP